MINLMKSNNNNARRISRAGLLMSVAMICAPILFAAPAAADDIADLKAENAALKEQIESLARDLQKLRDAVHQNEQAVAQVKAVTGTSKPAVSSGMENTKLSISGQINRMVMYADSGDEGRWFQADNDESSTRLRFVGSTALDAEWSAGTKLEVQFESNSSNDVTFNQNTTAAGSNSFTQRIIALYFASKRVGKLTLGQSDAASNGVTELDLSRTVVIASADSKSLGGSLEFHRSGTNGTGSGTTIGETFNNLDGLDRDDLIRYDTPTIAGAKLSTSWVDGDEFDVALRYGRDFEGTELALVLGYWDAGPTSQKDGYGGALSVALPFGTSLTGAYAEEDLEATGRESEQYWYAKLGHVLDLTPLGATALSLDYMATEDQDANGNEGTSYSLAGVQFLDRIGTEIYATFRWFDVDLPAIATDDIALAAIGARVKF